MNGWVFKKEINVASIIGILSFIIAVTGLYHQLDKRITLNEATLAIVVEELRYRRATVDDVPSLRKRVEVLEDLYNVH